jgi:DNA (cytosine-5)-methyltransferase 3A
VHVPDGGDYDIAGYEFGGLGMIVLSLFDGISVAQQALSELGWSVEEYYASEVDKYVMQVTMQNFPDTIQVGNVSDLPSSLFEGVDLLIGGSPCQDLSIAKKNRDGLAGDKSSLFFEYVRIKDEAKPLWFVFENVNSMPREAKQLITEMLGVEPIMIDASLISAQSRKRLFWTNIPNITQPEDRRIYLKDILEDGDTDRLKSYCVDASYCKGGNCKSYFERGRRQLVFNNNGTEKLKSNTLRIGGKGSGINDRHNYDTIRVGSIGNGGQGERVYSINGKSVNLSANGGGGRGAKTGLYEVKGIAKRTWDKGFKETEYRKDDKANSLTTVLTDSMVDTDNIIRKLTPLECERLQSLPDGYTEGISNTQRYRCLGNAFNCDVIKHILSFIPFGGEY